MDSRTYSIVVWVFAGVLLVLSLPATVCGGTTDRAQHLSLFDLSIVELMDVEINIAADLVNRIGCRDCKSLHGQAANSEETTMRTASSQDAAEPGTPSLPAGKPAKFDVR